MFPYLIEVVVALNYAWKQFGLCEVARRLLNHEVLLGKLKMHDVKG